VAESEVRSAALRTNCPMTCHSTRVSREESRAFELQSVGILREARGE